MADPSATLPIDAPATSARVPLLDAARGLAVAAMVVYHGAWDLSAFSLIPVDVGLDPGWRLFARLIAGSFLFITGFSLVLAGRRGLRAPSFLRRLAILALAAGAITLVTYFVFPDSYIFFGILHHIAVASVLALPFLRLPVALVLAAAAVFLFGRPFLAGPLFDAPALLWLGLYTFPPASNDYVPLFPWFGIVLLGLAAARLALAWGLLPSLGRVRAAGRLGGALRLAGRNSLAIYLVHQPILFGLAMAAAQLVGPAGREPADALQACVRSCVAGGRSEAVCRESCACMADSAALWPEPPDLSEAERVQRLEDIVRSCAPPDG